MPARSAFLRNLLLQDTAVTYHHMKYNTYLGSDPGEGVSQADVSDGEEREGSSTTRPALCHTTTPEERAKERTMDSKHSEAQRRCALLRITIK